MSELAVLLADARLARGYSRWPIPHPLDRELTSAVREYCNQRQVPPLPGNRDDSDMGGFLLLCFAERVASLSVIEEDETLLRTGLDAWKLGMSVVYWKEGMHVLPQLWRSAQKLGLDSTKVFEDAAEASPGGVGSECLREWVRREPELQTLACMGLAEKRMPNGAIYAET